SAQLTQRLDPGSYLLDVTGTGGATGYRLGISTKKAAKGSVAPVDPGSASSKQPPVSQTGPVTDQPPSDPPVEITIAHGDAGFETPNAAAPIGLTPDQVRHAYGIDQAEYNGQVLDGAGQTIAIVDAYNSPTIEQDLQAFDRQFNLADPQ